MGTGNSLPGRVGEPQRVNASVRLPAVGDAQLEPPESSLLDDNPSVRRRVDGITVEVPTMVRVGVPVHAS
jgi:hypothetical protein